MLHILPISGGASFVHPMGFLYAVESPTADGFTIYMDFEVYNTLEWGINYAYTWTACLFNA